MKAEYNQRWGEKNPNAKLTRADIAKIDAALLAGRSCADIGREFGVSKSCIQKVKRSETWPAST